MQKRDTNVPDPKWQFPQVPDELFTSKKFIPRLASEGPMGVNEKLVSYQASRESAPQRISKKKTPRGSEIFWTDDEIQKLKHLRLVDHKSFPAILHHFPKRSLGSIVGFWGRLKQKENLVDTTGQTKQLVSDVFWTEEEVEKLKYLRLQTKSSWPVIAQQFPKRSVRSLIAYWHRLNHNDNMSPLGRDTTNVTAKNTATKSYPSPVADRKSEEEEPIASQDFACNEASNSRQRESNTGQVVSTLERIAPSPLSAGTICPPENSDHSRSNTLQHLTEPLPNREDWLPLPNDFQETQPSVVSDFECATQLPSPSNSRTTEMPPVSIEEPAEIASTHFLEDTDVRGSSSYGFADELMKELVEAAKGDTSRGKESLPSEVYYESLRDMADLESNPSGDRGSELPSGLELELANGHENIHIPDLDGAEPNNSASTPSTVFESSPPTEALGFQTPSKSGPKSRDEVPSDDGVLITACGPSASLIETSQEKLMPSPERSAIPVLPSISHSKSGSRQLSQDSSTSGTSLLGAISAVTGPVSGHGHESKSAKSAQEKKSTAPHSNSRIQRSLATASNPSSTSKRRTEQRSRKRRSKSRSSRILKEIPSTSQPSSTSLSSLLGGDSEDELSFDTPTLVSKPFASDRSAKEELKTSQCGAGNGDVCMRMFCPDCMSSDGEVEF